MKSFQILRYLKRILPLIIVFCLLATYAVYYKLSTSNTYIASEVIHYNDEQAEKGLAPTGEKLDVNEIVLFLDSVEKGDSLTPKQKQFHEKTKVRDLAIMTLLLGTSFCSAS